MASLSVARKEFGEGSVNELEKLLMAAGSGQVAEFVEAVPHLSCLMAGAVHVHTSSSRGTDEALFTSNARATVKALHGLVIGPGVFISSYTGAVSTSFRAAQPAAAASLQAFQQRVLAPEQRHLPSMLAANISDVSALRFLAEVSAMKSSEEVAQAVKGLHGQAFVQTLRSSPTFASALMYSSFWGGLWDKIKGVVHWVSDAANAFGEEAAKVAYAVVEGVFSKFEGLTKFLEGIPGVGLVVAAIYSIAGKENQRTAALAINLNATVTFIATAIGAVAGPAGAMIGGALGKAAGLLVQEAIAQFISSPKIKADVGDISAIQIIIQIGLTSAAGAGAGAVADELATALAEAAGKNAVRTFIVSKGLPALLAALPAYLATEQTHHDKL